MTEIAKIKRKLWVVSELYYPEDTSTGYYLTKIAEGLANDYDVNVLCGQPTYSKRGTQAAKRENFNNVEIFRVAGTTLDKNIIPFRVINMLTLGISVFVSAIRRFGKGDRVLVVTNPPSMPFVVALASLFRGAGYYLLIHDNYPEILIAVGKARSDSIFVRLAHLANRWLYKHAVKIIVVGRDMEELVKMKTNGLDIPIVVIPNWAELDDVHPDPRSDNALIKELGLVEKIVVLYAGNIGYPNDIESIVECAEMMKDEGNFHFVFLGAGVKRKWLEAEIERRSLRNVTVLAPRPRSEQQVFLNACDIAVVSLVKGMKGVSMPSRTYNALAAGKPLLAITEHGSEIDLVVKENEVGWCVSPNDAYALYSVLKDIEISDSKFDHMAIRAREAAERDYSLCLAIDRYSNALDIP